MKSQLLWKICSYRQFCQKATAKTSERIIGSKFPDINVPNVNFGQWMLAKNEENRSQKALIHSEDNRYLTYGDLHRGTYSLASRLLKLNSGKPPTALCYMRNCPEMAFLFYGLPLIGGVLSPANPSYSDEELARQIDDSEAEFIFTDKQGVEVVNKALRLIRSKLVKKLIIIDGTTDGFDRFDDYLHDNGSQVDFNNSSTSSNVDWSKKMVFLPYSSGTTGLPKGVMLSHTNVVVNILQMEIGFKHRGKENSLCLLPMYHIYGLVPILGMSLYLGGTLVTMPKMAKDDFFQAIEKHKINFLPVVPPLVHLINSEFKHHCPYNFSQLRHMTCGAAPLDGESEKKLLDILRRQSPNFELENGYGMTEAAPLITCSPFTFEHLKHKTGSVGIVVPKMEVKVVDVCTGESLGANKPGELCTRGPNVMLGYWKNETATNSTIKDGWLHTGDIGYYDDEECFFIVDRLKELIKYKGLQVAPAELEGILMECNLVKDAAVVGKPDKFTGELPTAFVQLSDGVEASDETKAEIESFVASKVADYKRLRGGITFLHSIPKSAAGKIQRRELKENYL